MELKIILLIHLKYLNKNKEESFFANYFQYEELKLLLFYKVFFSSTIRVSQILLMDTAYSKGQEKATG